MASAFRSSRQRSVRDGRTARAPLWRRMLLVGATAALTTAVVAGAAQRLRRLLDAPRDLRHVGLLLPVNVYNGQMLALGRLFVPRGDAMLDDPSVRHVQIPGGMDGFVHDPPGRSTPGGAVLWLHGGGLIAGKPELEQITAHTIANELGVLVLNARYRLAPEHPFPAASDDVFAALQWMHENATMLGIDPERIAVAGESAGAGLAAALAQRAHDAGVPVAFQALVYPMLDDRTALASDHEGRGAVIWTPPSNRFAWTAYLGHPPRAEAPPAYAAAGRREDLSGLPPAWIGVGDRDLFYAEDIAYAERLSAAGVQVEVLVEPGMYHGADELAAHVPRMRAFREAMRDAIRRAIG